MNKKWRGISHTGLVARLYAHMTHTNVVAFRKIANSIKQRLPSGAKILELGSGPGYLAVELAKCGFCVSGIDISNDFTTISSKYAKRENVAVNFFSEDAGNLHFPSQSMDFVICHAAFKNFSDPLKVLNEIRRVLRKGGQAVIMDLVQEMPVSKDYIKSCCNSWILAAFLKILFWYLQHYYAYNRTELEHLVQGSSFSSVKFLDSHLGIQLELTMS